MLRLANKKRNNCRKAASLGIFSEKKRPNIAYVKKKRYLCSIICDNAYILLSINMFEPIKILRMRKILYILAVAALALGFASCEGPQGEPGRDGLVNSKIIDIQINQNEWSYSNIENNNYFFGAVSVPELTNDIYDNGIIKVYREYNTGTSNKSQVELPYTNYVEYPYTVDNETQWGFYQEHVYAEYAVGSVTIFYLASDFDYELDTSFVPEAMHFRMIMMW